MEYDLIVTYHSAYQGGGSDYDFHVQAFNIEVDGRVIGEITRGDYIDLVESGMPIIDMSPRHKDIIDEYLADYGFIDAGMRLKSIY